MSVIQQTRPNPYVGPRAFQYGERLYGRDQELMELLDLLIAERIVLLHSPSGAGKTSLIQAALIPELEREGFQVLPVMRVSLEPPPLITPSGNRYILSLLLSLEESLPPEQQSLLDELATPNLATYLDRYRAMIDQPTSTVLIFDQFEEILTVNPTDRGNKQAFFAQVGAALRDHQRWALFAMREEYLASLTSYVRPLPTRLSTTYRLELLGEQGARLAIQGPARQVGVDFTDGAAKKLVDDLRKMRVQQPDGTTEEQPGPYAEPVQLQVVCRRLWEKLPAGAQQIRETDVEAVGDVDSALAGYYDEQVAAITRETGVSESDVRDWFSQQLITKHGIRGQVLREPERSQGLDNRAIQPMVDAHLVRAEKRRGAIWYELTHDRSIKPIQDSNKAWRDKRQRTLLTALGTAVAILVVMLVLVSATSWVIQRQKLQDVERQAEATLAAAGATATQEGQQSAATAVAAAAVERAATQGAQQVEAEATAAVRVVTTQGAQQAEATATQAALALLPVEELRSMLTGPTPDERIAAAKALGQAAVASPETASEVVPLLAERLLVESEKEVTVRRVAAQALVAVAEVNPNAVANVATDLITALQDDDPEVRMATAQALGMAGSFVQDPEVSRQAAEALQILLSDTDANVRQAADEALSSFEMISIGAFVGHWANVDPDTQGITRIEVERAGYSLSFHTFAKCHPTDCDWGIARVPYAGVPVVVPYTSSIKNTTLTVTLEQASDQLAVKSFVHYTDDSGRADSTNVYVFARSAPEPTPTPTPTPVPVTAIRPADKLFVALMWERDGMAVVDVEMDRVERTISFDSINARYVSANPVRQEIYVSLANGDTFYVVDARSGAIKGTVQEEVGWNARNSVVSPDGSTVYLASSGGPEESKENKILVINPETLELEKVIRLGPYEFPNGLGRLEISPDGKKLYTIDLTSKELIVMDTTTGTVGIRTPAPGTRLLGTSTDGSALYVLDGTEVSKVQVETWTKVWGIDVQGSVDKVAVGAGIVYVPDGGSDQVILVEDGSGRVLGQWKVTVPGAVALAPDGTKLYVTSTEANLIYVLDTESGKQIGQIDIRIGSGPTDIVAMTVKIDVPTERSETE
jgi:YVTN family beta-propeller protein